MYGKGEYLAAKTEVLNFLVMKSQYTNSSNLPDWSFFFEECPPHAVVRWFRRVVKALGMLGELGTDLGLRIK